MTISARSTSSRSSSSRRMSESSRSKGPAKTSRSSSSSASLTPRRLGGSADGPDAHRLAHVRHDAGRDRLRLLGAGLEDALDVLLVLADLQVALARRGQPGGDLLADRGLEVPV